MKLEFVIEEKGDASVGIFATRWNAELTISDMEDCDPDLLDDMRRALIDGLKEVLQKNFDNGVRVKVYEKSHWEEITADPDDAAQLAERSRK